MGVSNLWSILNKAGTSRAIANLAVVDGFEKNENGTRSLRVGVDASLWLQHATQAFAGYGRKSDPTPKRDVGANPDLRTLFFRLCKLSRLPFSFLFVFDGPNRPKVKRGSKMGKSGSHHLARGFKQLLDIFGMDWRVAKGEAEAELACLNRIGSLDAIITDDVDTFLFGARTVIKNLSLNLTGNKPNPAQDANGKASDHHALIYTAAAIAEHPEVELTRGGLILIALLAGGDYDKGVQDLGLKSGHALARLGFGDSLLTAYESRSDQDFRLFVQQWRTEVETELHTNEHQRLHSRYPSFRFPPDFPRTSTLEMYVRPVTNASAGVAAAPPREVRSIDLPALARFCEDHFTEWGARSKILQRFKTLLTDGLVMTVLRAAALEADKREEVKQIADGRRERDIQLRGVLKVAPEDEVGTSATLVRRCLVPKKRATRDERMEHIAAAFVNRGSPEPEPEQRQEAIEEVEDRHPLIVGITRTREHVSTDKLFEYRVEVCPRQFVEIANSGIRGKHPDPEAARRGGDSDEEMDEHEDDQGGTKKSKDPNENTLLWIPASILRQVHPTLVEEYEERVRAKKSPKKRAAASAQPQAQDGAGLPHASATAPTASKGKGKGRARGRAPVAEEYDNLAINPFASAAPARGDFTPMAECSFPQRAGGFVFTWPDPDDPDNLVVDSERDDLPTTVDYADVEARGGLVYREYEGVPVPVPAPARPRPRAAARAAAAAPATATASGSGSASANASQPARRQRVTSTGTGARQRGVRAPAQDEQDDDDEPWSEPEDGGPLSNFDRIIDQALGILPGGRSGAAKRKRPQRPARGRPRAGASGSRAGQGTQDRQPPAKRRKAGAGGTGSAGADARASLPPANRRRSEPFPDIPSLSSDEERPSSPAPPPPSSQPSAASQTRGPRPRPVARRDGDVDMDMADVISISSDSDSDSSESDVWASVRVPLYTLRKAAESDRSLSRSQAAEDVEEDEPDEDEEVPIETFDWGDNTWGSGYAKTARRPAGAGAGTASASASGSKSVSASGRGVYRDARPAVPSSSQESALDDEGDFFRGVSIVKNLT